MARLGFGWKLVGIAREGAATAAATLLQEKLTARSNSS